MARIFAAIPLLAVALGLGISPVLRGAEPTGYLLRVGPTPLRFQKANPKGPPYALPALPYLLPEDAPAPPKSMVPPPPSFTQPPPAAQPSSVSAATPSSLPATNAVPAAPPAPLPPPSTASGALPPTGINPEPGSSGTDSAAAKQYVTPEMLLPYFQHPIGTNTGASVYLPFGFTPPAATPPGSSSATFQDP